MPPLQFWTDCSLPEPPPEGQALETSLPVVQSETHRKILVDEGGVLLQPRRHHEDNDLKHSPFSAPKDFFTAVAGPGYTSVPALIVCIYAFRKAIIEQASVVGQYEGTLGLKSKLLFFVNVLSFIFFFIPWSLRFLIFYNYTRNGGDSPERPCVVFAASQSICRFNDPISELPPLDWGFVVLCALAASYYFQMCTSVILQSGIYKASSHQLFLVL